MAGEYSAQVQEPFIPTVVVANWKGTGRQVRMNAADYDPERDGEIIEGPTIRPNTPGQPAQPLKDPHLDADGGRIADLPSPMLKA